MAAVQDKRGGIPDNLNSLAVNYSAPYYSNNVNVNHTKNIGPGAGGQNYNSGPGAGGENSGKGAGAINANRIDGGVMNQENNKPRVLPKGSFDGDGPIRTANGPARTTQESPDSSLPLPGEFFKARNPSQMNSRERDAEPIKYGNGVIPRRGRIFDQQEDHDHNSLLGNNSDGFVIKKIKEDPFANPSRFGQRAPQSGTVVQFAPQPRSSVVSSFPQESRGYGGFSSSYASEHPGLPFYSQPQTSALSIGSELPRRSVLGSRPSVISTRMTTGPMTGGFGSSQGFGFYSGF